MPRRLDLSDKAVELMAYLSLHRDDVSDEEIARALWPRKPLDRAMQLLVETAEEVNAVVARESGNPTPVIAPHDRGPTLPGPQPPRLMVRILGKPCVELYEDHEPLRDE